MPGRLRRALFVLLMCMTAGAFAHGGVAVEDDTCIMTIGTYKAHFTGYQPQVRASQEFCEDIPMVAESIIVLDFISRPLRDMLIDFRIVKDVNEVGVTATIDDLGSAEDIERATMFRRPPEKFPRGSVDVTIEFIDEGTDTRREYVSVFPFSVGVTNWWARLKWIVAPLLLGAVLLFWTTRSRDSTAPAS